MDLKEYLTRERERERESERERECVCVKETWTTHDKVEKKCACLMQTYHAFIFEGGSEVRR
jgi:hypothetical protein